MELFYFMVFGALGAVVAALQLSKNNKDRINTSPAFNSFKNNCLVVYSLMMAGDWLQGPYVYYLYSTYGFGKGEIGQLFIAGFGSSILFGTIVGSLADKQGRKRACITYCITYILSCITKHSPQYKILMIGRVLGGIATSLLFSAFESWLVAEHNKVDAFPITVMFGMCSIFLFVASILQRRLLAISDKPKIESWTAMKERDTEAEPLND